MSIAFGIKVLVEVILVLLIGYGIWHEDELVAFENELFPVLKQWVKRGFKKGKGNNEHI